MARFTPFVCFLLLAFPYVQVSAFDPVSIAAVSALIGIVTGIITFANQASEGIKGGMRYLGEEPENDDGYKRPFNPMHSSLMDQLRYLSKKSDLLKADIDDMRDEIINQVSEKVPGLVELNSRLSEIFVKSVSIAKDYDNFLRYYEHPEKYDKNRVIQFARKMVSDDSTGVTHQLERIHTLLVRRDITTPSAVVLLANHIDLFIRNAKLFKSPQQLLYDFLNSIIYTEIKGYLTIKYCYNLLSLYKQEGKFGAHIEDAEHDFGKRLNITVETFKSAMNLVSRELWRNNPVQHIEDVTYTELKHVFQKYIINEYDISPGDQCKNQCSDYRRPESKAPHRCAYQGEICEITHCDGYLFDCQYKIDTEMSICPSGRDSSRRYDYIDYANGLRYGDSKHKCSMNPLTTTRKLSGLWWCDPCMCVCADTSKKSESRFNLDPVMANSAENYVLTGARLVKRNRMIHIQIQEGQLLQNGRINASTLRWSKINENPISYHTLQWEQKREIHLDDLMAPKNHVLTGLSFTTIQVDSAYTKRLKLQAYAAPLYFHSGEVIDKHQMPLYPKDFSPTNATNEIKLDNLDVPTRTSVQTVTKSKQDQFLKFGPTGLDKDVGQSTIPFIDIQEVTTSPAIPMSGAGIYHKSRSGNGGFLALRLFSYDYAQHLEADLPEDYESLDSVKGL
ncbi:uncharacterized protein LOC103316723 [Nasonia vitripennis]|uniref:Uncharacterized protein n=1 Tax=Nasonia vitripennis TaxID=7425 RepID=A0A7M7J2X8_NASVI|nr:uncharacterized protein LOC103316723 [Nasonia vitripennis]